MKKPLLFSLSLVLVAACGSSGDVTDGGGDASIDDQASQDVQQPLGDAQPGVPITGTTPGTWTWVDFPGAVCRDGTPTGIGVNPSTTGSKKLMIFLEGGGACFNSQTCSSNPSHFGKAEFTGVFVPAEGNKGIFSRTDTKNAVADWNMVYVPYCTGDVHAGNAPDATVTGVAGKQQFVGYTNMGQYLSRIVPTFPDMDRVLLSGQSAGGFGAALNYVQTARNFGTVPVDLLDDSGPLFSNAYLASCLETSMANLWGLTKTVIGQDCGTDCPDVGNALAEYWVHLPKTYPGSRFGFIDSSGDSVISSFFGFGSNNCGTFKTITPAQYEAGLLDMRTAVSANTNAGLFIYSGTDHTTVVSMYTTRSAPSADAGTVQFEDWVKSLVTDSVTNVGP